MTDARIAGMLPSEPYLLGRQFRPSPGTSSTYVLSLIGGPMKSLARDLRAPALVLVLAIVAAPFIAKHDRPVTARGW